MTEKPLIDFNVQQVNLHKTVLFKYMFTIVILILKRKDHIRNSEIFAKSDGNINLFKSMK